MCELSGKIIAWLDHELGQTQAADLEEHLEVCGECQRQLKAYSRASKAVDEYCDAIIAAQGRLRIWRPFPVLASAATAMAVLVLLLFVQGRVGRAPAQGPPAMAAQTAAPVRIGAPATIRHTKHIARLAEYKRNIFPSAESAIQIAIPADAMFPPGAVPEGVSFVAELSIAADGSVQNLRLQP
jgi:hypothetical protein